MYRQAALAFLTGVLFALPASAQTVAVGTGDPAVTADTATAKNVTTTKNVTTAKKLATAKKVATVNVVSGQVSINRGEGFKPVVKTTQANVGDQVMVRPDSQAKIVYAEGCAVDVNPGAVVGVAGSCKVATAKPMLAGLEAPVAAAVAAPIWPYFVGAALIGGAICAGACESNEHHHGASHD